MCAQTTRLSDRQLKAVKPKDKDYVLTDGDGLQLRVRVNRSMQWNFNYRHPVTKNRINMALGSYPEVSLAQARKKTVEARELLAQGIDPKAQRNELQESKRAETEHTFENVATTELTEEEMRRALFGEPEHPASIIDNHEQDTATEIVIAEPTRVVKKKKLSKAFTPRLRVTPRVGNEFESKMHEIIHEADTLSSLAAEQEATKIAKKIQVWGNYFG